MAKTKSQTRYQKGKASFGTMSECGRDGFLKDMIDFK